MRSNRRQFIHTLGLGTVSGLTFSPFIPRMANLNLEIPKLDAELVSEFVRVAHFDFDAVRKMLEETPNLLNATQDWGDGDFETAIGAAGHMGLKEMANYLIDQGARFDLFVLTMLGKTSIVKGVLELYPDLLNSIGPHGFTLLHHAEKGGPDADELHAYLQSKGLIETFIPTFKKE